MTMITIFTMLLNFILVA